MWHSEPESVPQEFHYNATLLQYLTEGGYFNLKEFHSDFVRTGVSLLSSKHRVFNPPIQRSSTPPTVQGLEFHSSLQTKEFHSIKSKEFHSIKSTVQFHCHWILGVLLHY